MNYLEHYPSLKPMKTAPNIRRGFFVLYSWHWFPVFLSKEKFYHMSISIEKQCGFLKYRENFLIFANEKHLKNGKACQWLQDNLEIPEDGVISEEDGKWLLGDKPLTFIEEFKKAMEED